MPPGMDPSFLFRSPFSDAENNNLMAAAAIAAEKARAMMMMGGMPASGARGPPGPTIGGPHPHSMFLNAALACSQAPPTSSSTLPQLYTLSSNNHENPVNQLSLNPAMFSHWNAVHHAILAASAASSLQTSTNGSTSCANASPLTNLLQQTTATSTASDLRLVRPLFTGMPGPAMRFSPYVIPTGKSRSTPSPTRSPASMSEGRPSSRPDTTSPPPATASPPRSY
jgi:hypothetical protein